MKKIASIFMMLVLLVSMSICAFATGLSDGTYEVPVVLMHKENEKESTGNKYIHNKGILTVEKGEMRITILLTTDMDGIEFSYYEDGSLSGDTADATAVSNVELGGNIYGKGFEIPIVANGDIGLKFSVPVMPMSPSARLRIDYQNAVSISSEAKTEATTEAVLDVIATTTSPVPDIITQNVQQTSEVITQVSEMQIVDNNYISESATNSVSVTEQKVVNSTTSTDKSSLKTIIIVIVSIWCVSLISILISRRKK